MPSNFENWKLYTQNLTSPESYIEFGYYYLINTCLQRRVWYDEPPYQMFVNPFVLLIGPPATGKGLVIGTISHFLKYHRRESGQVIRTNVGDEKPLLFPTGADCITFEQLLAKMASNATRFTTPDKKPYSHTSLWFALEELASMFKHKTEDVIKFLQNAYDGKDYDYEIKHQEKKDRIRNICLSFIAGTQYDFLIKAQKIDLFGQGLASRFIWLFESQPRFIKFHIAEKFTDKQRRAEQELLTWLKQLSTVYGRITYSEETAQYLQDWYEFKHMPKQSKASPRMAEYLSRIKAHVRKVAVAMHFSENLTLTIPLETFQRAIKSLEKLEHNIEAGFSLIGRNPLHAMSRKIYSYIKDRKEVLESELVLTFGGEISIEELYLCLKELELGFQLKNKLAPKGRMFYL